MRLPDLPPAIKRRLFVTGNWNWRLGLILVGNFLVVGLVAWALYWAFT